MKLFETWNGFVFSFGFDMGTRQPRPNFVCWCDPATKEWETRADNQAGSIEFPIALNTENVIEHPGGLYLLQASEKYPCVEFVYVGPPLVWSYIPLRHMAKAG